MSSYDDETGYDRGDPKHPGYAEAAYDRADFRRKQAREEGLTNATGKGMIQGSGNPDPQEDPMASKQITKAAQDYTRLVPTDDAPQYKVRLHKDGSTWSYFTENEVGGGFGSNQSGCSMTAAISIAISNIPDGATVSVEINDEQRGTYRRVKS